MPQVDFGSNLTLDVAPNQRCYWELNQRCYWDVFEIEFVREPSVCSMFLNLTCVNRSRAIHLVGELSQRCDWDDF